MAATPSATVMGDPSSISTAKVAKRTPAGLMASLRP